VVNQVIGDAAELVILHVIHPIRVMGVYVRKNVGQDSQGLPLAEFVHKTGYNDVCKAIEKFDKTGGGHTVIGMGQEWSPQYSALLNGFLGHSLNFDDTYAEGFLHASVTTISAGLTDAQHAAFIAAFAVGYEVTCPIGRALGEVASSRVFHSTVTAGIFETVATIAKIKGLSPSVIETAFGLAGSKAAGSMQHLDNRSWNKRLHPGFASP
jgi:2-methylcitrate dehydratase PrpD